MTTQAALPSRRQPLSGWGRFPIQSCELYRPASVVGMRAMLLGHGQSSYIARGLGRSYGDSALNSDRGVILTTQLNHLLVFDDSTGILECESGVSFAEILDVFLPRGWRLPVTPGTRFVTLGGAIAADVHGKNHHRVGSLGNFIQSIDLLTADGQVRECSPSKEPRLFWATIGGMGLTGIVLRARIQLIRVPSAYCNVTYRRTRDLETTLDCFDQADQQYEYSVAWIDGLSRGGQLGRSVVMLANDAPPDALPAGQQSRPYDTPRRRTHSVPCEAPRGLLNSWFVRAFNSCYYAAHPDGERCVDLFSFFYPLDAVENWNRLYGRAGFVQFQAWFPVSTSRAGLVAVLEEVTASRAASFLAVLKRCGPANRGLMSYLDVGHTLALDFMMSRKDVQPLLNRLEAILLRYAGRVYLAKDATASPQAFAEMYPQLSTFCCLKQEVDPLGRFQSSQARRLGIVRPT